MLQKVKQVVLLAVFVGLSTYSGYFLGLDRVDKEAVRIGSVSQESVSQQIGLPANLKIPKIGVDAPVEPVGLDRDGKMGVPSNADLVGWYKLGVKPGERGNAVFAGHLDTVTGAPAVFYNLSKLEVGDEIISTDISGRQYVFKVTDKQTYLYNSFPLQDIFGDSQDIALNLITCAGVFDQISSNYNQRIVIFSKLEQ